MAKRLVSTGHFVALDPSGKRLMLEILTEFEDVVAAGYFRSAAGQKLIKTETGQRVHRVENGKYEIAGTSTILTSNDPLAP